MIKFGTHKERMQHPQAKLIPEALWVLLFNSSLDKRILPLMKVGIEKLGKHLLSPHQKQKALKKVGAWLAIALSHPGLALSTLQNIATFLGIVDNEDFFQVLLLLGNKTHVETFADKISNSNNIPDWIANYKSSYYMWAAIGGNPELLKYFEKKFSDQIPAMIAEADFYAYRISAKCGNLEVLKHLEKKFPDQIKAMIAVCDFYAYKEAFNNKHFAIAKKMLAQSSACFSYAERQGKYSEQINSFIQEMLENLRQQAADIPTQEVFDITDREQAKIGLSIIRRFNRLNDTAYDKDLDFLLSIPSVNALYLNCESSMKVLAKEEEQCLGEAIKYYQPMLDEEGVPQLMNKLREELSERYKANPVTIRDQHGKTISLPMNFTQLQEAKLNPKEYGTALKAYYQHKDHSAWRFLAKSNPWMHPNASFVRENPTRTELWSCFEDHQLLIVLFWLAACDAHIPPNDGQTLETRVDHFIDELAHIGRAHNWDNTRINSRGEKEEYDDLSADRPSCFGGVKRRLFQSVLGHRLLTILTQDGLLEEVRTFVRDYFKAQINPHNAIDLKNAFEDCYDNTNDLSEDSKNVLASFNIPNEKQQEFDYYLEKKYGAEYAENLYFKKSVTDNFALKLDSTQTSDHYHALKLNGLARVYDSLLKAAVSKPPKQGFFNSALDTQKSISHGVSGLETFS